MTLRHLLPWDIQFVIDETVDEEEEEPEVRSGDRHPRTGTGDRYRNQWSHLGKNELCDSMPGMETWMLSTICFQQVVYY
jgi:hypothetical protein